MSLYCERNYYFSDEILNSTVITIYISIIIYLITDSDVQSLILILSHNILIQVTGLN